MSHMFVCGSIVDTMEYGTSEFAADSKYFAKVLGTLSANQFTMGAFAAAYMLTLPVFVLLRYRVRASWHPSFATMILDSIRDDLLTGMHLDYHIRLFKLQCLIPLYDSDASGSTRYKSLRQTERAPSIV